MKVTTMTQTVTTKRLTTTYSNLASYCLALDIIDVKICHKRFLGISGKKQEMFHYIFVRKGWLNELLTEPEHTNGKVDGA